jgi:hypothetical protein
LIPTKSQISDTHSMQFSWYLRRQK